MFKSQGWKGVIGGSGLIVYAIVGVVIKLVLPDSQYGMELMNAIPVLLAGLGVLGIRLKQG